MTGSAKSGTGLSRRQRRPPVSLALNPGYSLWCRPSGLGVSQEGDEQFTHLLRLLLLNPMAGAVDQVKANHPGAGARLHAFHSARRLIDAPIALPGNEHRRHVDGAAREGMHLRNALGIASATNPIALQGAGKAGPA